ACGKGSGGGAHAGHKATPVHHPARRRGGMAARGRRAAARANAAHRVLAFPRPERSGNTSPRRGVWTRGGRRCGPRFTISLKRSALIFSYPQAGRPITPSIGGITDINGRGTSVNSIERTLGSLYRAAPLRYIPFPCWPRCDQSAPNDFAKICHSGARVDACAGGRGICPNRSERSPYRTAEFWSAGTRHQGVRCRTYSWVLEARLCYRSLSAFRAAVS